MTAERSAWASRMIARASGPLVAYGSPKWLALPDGDARKVAAVVAAAESWALDGDQLEERIWAECLAASRANKAADDAEWIAQQAEHRETWTGTHKLLTHPLAIARRRAMEAA